MPPDDVVLQSVYRSVWHIEARSTLKILGTTAGCAGDLEFPCPTDCNSSLGTGLLKFD